MNDFENQLHTLKIKYFASPFLSFANFVMLGKIILPENTKVEDFLDWETEKNEFLSKEKVSIENIAIVYQKNVVDRIDASSAVVMKIKERLINEELDTKDLKDLTYTLKQISEVMDSAMSLLKVSSYNAKEYEKNTVEIDKKIRIALD